MAFFSLSFRNAFLRTNRPPDRINFRRVATAAILARAQQHCAQVCKFFSLKVRIIQIKIGNVVIAPSQCRQSGHCLTHIQCHGLHLAPKSSSILRLPITDNEPSHLLPSYSGYFCKVTKVHYRTCPWHSRAYALGLWKSRLIEKGCDEEEKRHTRNPELLRPLTTQPRVTYHNHTIFQGNRTFIQTVQASARRACRSWI